MGAFLAILASIFTVVGNIYAKEWAVRSGVTLFLLTQAAYLLGSLAFPFALRYGTLASLTALAAVATSLITIVIGVVIYHEQMTTPHVIGVVLSFVAVILLSFPMKA